MKKDENQKIIKELKEFFTIHNFYKLVSDFDGIQNLYDPLEIKVNEHEDPENAKLLNNSELLRLSTEERNKYFSQVKADYINKVVNEPVRKSIPFLAMIHKKMSFITYEFLQKLGTKEIGFKNISDYDFDFTAIVEFQKEFENYLKIFRKQLKKSKSNSALGILKDFEIIYDNFKSMNHDLEKYFLEQGFSELILYNNYSFFVLYKFSAQLLEQFWNENFENKNGEFIFDKTDKYFITFYLEYLEIKKNRENEYFKVKDSTRNLLKAMELVNDFKEKMQSNLIRLSYRKLIDSFDGWMIKFYFLYLIHLSIYEFNKIIDMEKIYNFFKLDIWPTRF
ncbi:hypothetical protein [Spiroplasma endosymbiont of Panorpa germanica]|uniref:hypothetical protein n=1 Tax=Spiroplasma endosymbiont of Panorpa germanica TaxID=3066314 RepID=UPI0030CB8263